MMSRTRAHLLIFGAFPVYFAAILAPSVLINHELTKPGLSLWLRIPLTLAVPLWVVTWMQLTILLVLRLSCPSWKAALTGWMLMWHRAWRYLRNREV